MTTLSALVSMSTRLFALGNRALASSRESPSASAPSSTVTFSPSALTRTQPPAASSSYGNNALLRSLADARSSAWQYLYGVSDNRPATFQWSPETAFSQPLSNPSADSRIDLQKQVQDNLLVLRAGQFGPVTLRNGYPNTPLDPSAYAPSNGQGITSLGNTGSDRFFLLGRAVNLATATPRGIEQFRYWGSSQPKGAGQGSPLTLAYNPEPDRKGIDMSA